jgi:NAD(P)-dependent dehydrogenase (short-subunit alcohol dehydrogenase family)
MVEQAVSEFGCLDFACNNAVGGGHPPMPLAEIPLEGFDPTIPMLWRSARHLAHLGTQVGQLLLLGRARHPLSHHRMGALQRAVHRGDAGLE